MKDALQIEARHVYTDEGGKAYVEYHLGNQALQNFAYHGADLTVTSSVAAAIADYWPLAAEQLLAVVEANFPGQYEL